MATVNETVILEINVEKTIEQLTTYQRTLEALKKSRDELTEAVKAGGAEEQKNREALENTNVAIKQANAEYKAQQNIYTSYLEQKKRGTQIENFNNNSIKANRELLKQLTAQYIELKNPSKAATDTINNLTATLKKQEAAIGDTRRNVGNYKNDILDAVKSLNILPPSLSNAVGNLGAFSKGIGGASAGLGGLRAAILATGIGALVVAIGAAVTFLTKFEDGSELVERKLSALGGAVDFAVGKFGNLGKSIVESLGEATQKTIGENIKSIGNLIKDGLIGQQEGIAETFKGVGKLLTLQFDEAADAIQNGVLKTLTFGAVSKDSFKDFVDGAAAAAKQAELFTKQLQDIEELERENAVAVSKNQIAIDSLLISARNRGKEEKERLKLLEQASNLERENLNLELSGAKERLRIITEQTNIKRQQGIVSEKVTEEELSAIKKVDDLNRQSLALQEKIANRRFEIEDRLKKVREDAFNKQRERELTFAAATGANLEEELNFLAEQGKRRVAVFELEFEDRRTKLRDAGVSEVQIVKIYEQEKTAIVQDEANKQAAIIQKKNEQNEAALKLLRENADKQLELQITFNKSQQEIDDEFAASNLQTFSEFYEAKKHLYENDVRAKKKAADEQKKIDNAILSAGQSFAAIFSATADFIGEKTKEASILQKIAAGIQLAVNTAVSISSAIAGATEAASATGPGAPFALAGYIASMIATVIAAVAQASSILSEAPSFALGGQAAGDGFIGTVGGKSHSDGGTKYYGEDGNVVEFERGEGLYVMKKTAQDELSRFSQWNQLFGGRSWGDTPVSHAATGGQVSDGGFIIRETSNRVDNNIILENAIRRGFASAPIPTLSIVEFETKQQSRNRSIEISEV